MNFLQIPLVNDIKKSKSMEILFTSVLKATTVSIFGRFISLYFFYFTNTQILDQTENKTKKPFCTTQLFTVP